MLPQMRSFLVGLVLIILLACLSEARGAQSKIIVLDVNGPIVPVTERYIERGLSHAEDTNAPACVITLNTPGGLYNTTQNIVQKIMNAKIPVIVYVSPAGGWAGSAGTFITISAHVAAMAPGSRIGAAHPVAGQGQELPETQNKKITEDAAAWARSIAEARKRNADKAALAVTESRSYTDKEALQNNLIDLRAASLHELLQKVDGQEVTIATGQRLSLNTAGAQLYHLEMTFSEKFLHTVSDPNVVYILMMLGMLGLIFELSNPGLIFPGVIGGISLLISLYSLGTLDASWSGVLLILLGFGLFVAEIFVPSFGILTIGGIISLFAGSLMLFSQQHPMPQISYGLIAGTVVSVTAIMAFIIHSVIKAHRRQVTIGKESFRGNTGLAVTDLKPHGTVLFEGERWKAVAEEGEIESGSKVLIDRVEGLTLYVRKK